MKLDEIFDTSTEVKFSRREFTPNAYPKPTKDELGRGAFSIARTDSTDPHMVIKRQKLRSDTMKDGFNGFAEIVARDQLWDMIHFPRVYAIKKIMNKDETIGLHRWRMEKLIGYNQLSGEEINALTKRYFNMETNSVFSIADNICRAINGDTDIIVDDTLLKAVYKMSDIFDEVKKSLPHVFLDLHGENLMFRRTHVGIDAVISDPLAAGR
jgi:hypothetical protein